MDGVLAVEDIEEACLKEEGVVVVAAAVTVLLL